MQPADPVAKFSPWQPAMLGRKAGFGQEQPFISDSGYFKRSKQVEKYVLIVLWVAGTGFAWRRIFSCTYSWYIKLAALAFTLAPIFGPVFYFMIDPPDNSPIEVSPDNFRQPSKGTSVWPSFTPLLQSLASIFRRAPKEPD